MDVENYLRRIGYVAPAMPTLDVLRSVHVSHLMSVPFENLTLHSGGQVRLDLPLLYDKIVNQRRGGFCFENNSLFSWLLSRLGFQVTLLSGQVRNSITGRYGPPFDHLISMVTLEGRRWLCDVGYGSSGFTFPISLEVSGTQRQGHREYRVRNDQGMCFLEWQGEEDTGAGGDWTELYKFTLEPRRLEDFVEMCQYHQTSPSSIFFCKSLCSILKPEGRLNYIGRKLNTITFPSEVTGAVVKTTEELEDEQIPAVLAEHFGVVLNSPLKPKDEAITPPPPIY
uniref:arylamine N-acetyltransferase n=2 Tax=Myripristis murdjan TaxID=586833 RepID=A0A667XDQ0_9TELE